MGKKSNWSLQVRSGWFCRLFAMYYTACYVPRHMQPTNFFYCLSSCTVNAPERDKMKYILRIVVLVSTLATPTLCFSSGAPVDACETLMPNHTTTSQPESTNPYELDLSQFIDPEDNTVYYVPGVTYTSMLQFCDLRGKGFYNLYTCCLTTSSNAIINIHDSACSTL